MNRGRYLLLVAALGALLSVAGCGSSSSDEVTIAVKTGSLSKAEFIAKADAICKAARTEFAGKLANFFKENKSAAERADEAEQEALFSEMIESVVAPNIEGEIAKISELGAPKDYVPEVASFLNALQKRLDEGKEDPNGLTKTPTPFAVAESIARRAAMDGCAESFG